MRDVEASFFLEDAAHERFIPALAARIAAEEGFNLRNRVFNAQGGVPAVIGSFRRFIGDLSRGTVQLRSPIVVVGLDVNDVGTILRKRQIAGIVERSKIHLDIVHALPEPYIERWLMADPGLLHKMWGGPVALPSRRRPTKGDWKKALADAAAPVEPLFGGTEYGEDIAAQMDLSRAITVAPEIGEFARELRVILHST